MTEAVAAEDVAFLAQLRDLVNERQAALPPVVGMGSAPDRDPLRRAQEDVRAQWDFDGSVVIGRADTVEGQRYYIGTRSVVTPEDHVVVVAQDSALGRAVWKDTSVMSPARTALKRHLQVSGWAVTRSQTEFDLRPGTPGSPPARSDASVAAAPGSGAAAAPAGVAGPGESGERRQPPAGPAAAMPAPPTGAPVAGGLATPLDGPDAEAAAGGPAAPGEVAAGQAAAGVAAAVAGDAAAAEVPSPAGGAAPGAVPQGEPGTAAPEGAAAAAAASQDNGAAAGEVAGSDAQSSGAPTSGGQASEGASASGATSQVVSTDGSAAESSSPTDGASAADVSATVDVAVLDQARTGAAQALREALARVESGAGGAAAGLAPVAVWDTAIADAAAVLELPEDAATLDHVSAELTRREEERKAAERAALDERIEVVQRWLDGGGPGADEARAFLDQLTRLRAQP